MLEQESVIERLKLRARSLQRSVERHEPAALQRMRKLPELRALRSEVLVERVQRRHCLSLLARELGLNGWSHLTELWSIEGAQEFGALFYPSQCGGSWNIWSSSVDEARAIRGQHGGYLLPYRRQMLIVERPFIDDLGVAAEDPDWDRIGRNWIEPADFAARHRQLKALLAARVSS